MGVVLDVLDHDAMLFYKASEFFIPLTDKQIERFVSMASPEPLVIPVSHF